MKVSESWLKAFCPVTADSKDIAHQLTMAGLEVEAIQAPTLNYQHMVVAQVKQVIPHPNADKLSVCDVDAGNYGIFTVVCGAKNVRTDLKVAFAMIGAQFPTLTIKKAKLRGVESHGMLCSESELGMAAASPGILELPEDAPVGTDLAEYLSLSDVIVDISLTPNRGDCASVLGLGRELSALYQTPIQLPDIPNFPTSQKSLSIENANDSPVYYLRQLKGIDNTRKTPIWIQQRLQQCGLHTVSAVVDIVNFVMLELGQPMHVFDRSELNGITVRNALPKETLHLLNDREYTCQGGELVIAKGDELLALAGIMGGLPSSATEATQDIVLESAYFSPEAIAKTARHTGIQSDAAYRFERGVDPEGVLRALNRATDLILTHLGGELIETACSLNAETTAQPTIPLHHQKLCDLLGLEVTIEQATHIFGRLNMQVNVIAQTLHVIPPAYRHDIRIAEDLIEEFIRLYGYQHIPSTNPCLPLSTPTHYSSKNAQQKICQYLVDIGFIETIHYSFIDPRDQEIFSPKQPGIALRNPISREKSVMRMHLLPGLLKAAAYNLNRQHERVCLFESGACFFPENKQTSTQTEHLAVVMAGHVWPEQWGQQSRVVDFYDIKQVLASVLNHIEPAKEVQFIQATSMPGFHPGQTASVVCKGQPIGIIGALHPDSLAHFDIESPLFAFEIDLRTLSRLKKPNYTPESKLPSIRRDIAFKLDKSISSDEILQQIHTCDTELTPEVFIFDVYYGAPLHSHEKSLAIALIFQSVSQTLTDEAVAKHVDIVLSSLKEQFNIELRE